MTIQDVILASVASLYSLEIKDKNNNRKTLQHDCNHPTRDLLPYCHTYHAL